MKSIAVIATITASANLRNSCHSGMDIITRCGVGTASTASFPASEMMCLPSTWHASDAVAASLEAGALRDWGRLVAMYPGW
jgi:hypothetical protein